MGRRLLIEAATTTVVTAASITCVGIGVGSEVVGAGVGTGVGSEVVGDAVGSGVGSEVVGDSVGGSVVVVVAVVLDDGELVGSDIVGTLVDAGLGAAADGVGDQIHGQDRVVDPQRKRTQAGRLRRTRRRTTCRSPTRVQRRRRVGLVGVGVDDRDGRAVE